MPVQASSVGGGVILPIFHLSARSWVSGQHLAALSGGKRSGIHYTGSRNLIYKRHMN